MFDFFQAFRFLGNFFKTFWKFSNIFKYVLQGNVRRHFRNNFKEMYNYIFKNNSLTFRKNQKRFEVFSSKLQICWMFAKLQTWSNLLNLRKVAKFESTSSSFCSIFQALQDYLYRLVPPDCCESSRLLRRCLQTSTRFCRKFSRAGRFCRK